MDSTSVSVGRIAAKILYRLVSIPSPSRHEREAAKAFMEEALSLGLDSWMDSVGNVYAAPEKAQRRAVALLASHIDTVEGWIEPQISTEYVYGRGAVDAKGSLTSMLLAVNEIARQRPDAPIAVTGLVDEEADSTGAWYLVESKRVPSYIVIGEPTGSSRVAIGYRGSMRIEILCTGRGGHTASPWAGDSALDKLLDYMLMLKKDYTKPTVMQPTVAITKLEAGDATNTLPRRAKAILDLRIPPHVNPEQLLKDLRTKLPQDCTLSIIGKPTPPVKVPPTSPVPRALIRALLVQGIKPSPVVKAGTSDMNILAPYTKSIAAYGPGDPSLAHTDSEKVHVRELEIATKTYMHAILELLERSSRDNPKQLPV